MRDRVVVRSPATIANFGPGFDCFGICLESPSDVVSIRKAPEGRRELKVLGGYPVPSDPAKNTASYSAMRLAELCGFPDAGFCMSVRKGIRPGSGLGSSAASSAGGALAMAVLLGVQSKEVILEAAAMGEELVSGSRHFDNVAAALYGGFTVVSDHSTRRVIRLRPPSFKIIVALPEISVETRRAREILPGHVPIESAVRNIALASGMVHAVMKRDIRSMGVHLDDNLAVPYRQSLIPGFEEVKKSALAAGALGVSIGGSGPAVFAIAEANARKIQRAMSEAFRRAAGLRCETFVTVPGSGAKVEVVR
ncbi:MAG: homoserine kinase [Thermoplasmata archaeon]